MFVKTHILIRSTIFYTTWGLGKPIPFEDIGVAMANKEVRGTLNFEQALADYAEIIIATKRQFFIKIRRCLYSVVPTPEVSTRPFLYFS